MRVLYEYITANYVVAEPIFFSDIEIEGVSRSAVSQQIKKLCNEKKLAKYGNGVYYLPKKSRLSESIGINADTVARYKFIEKKEEIFGFYAGHYFANQMGISTQVPNKVEIVSNNIAAKVREIPIGNREFIVRKPVVPVNRDNVHVLQLLDLLKNLDAYLEEEYADAREKFRRYIDAYEIKKTDIDRYIRKFPVAVFKYYYEMGLENVLA